MAIITGEPLDDPGYVILIPAYASIHRSRYLVDLFRLFLPLSGEATV